VQGVDVWLNTPRRPQEASGTSGQKAAINGVLNCSTLDGWWAEAWNGSNGFAIGDASDCPDPELQDQHDALSLYQVLQQQIIPPFYERDPGGLPGKWLQMMKNSIISLGWQYSSHRMVRDYAALAWQPATEFQTSAVVPDN
jgi:starch phosphorylase